MKKLLIAYSLILLLLASGLAFGNPDKRSFTISKNAKQISDDMYDLGSVNSEGQILHGYMFVHKKSDAKSQASASRNPNTVCYSYYASGTKWKNTESYVLDTTNAVRMDETFISNTVQQSLNTWNSQVAFRIFGSRANSSTVDGADTSAPDGKNEIMFGSISDPGVIAVTTVWGVFSGPVKNRVIVEFDAVFDDADFTWGDASYDSSLMDLQNIATHEFGHAAGLDHPQNSCTEETMYAYASSGETKKRDLNLGDITGIKNLYN